MTRAASTFRSLAVGLCLVWLGACTTKTIQRSQRVRVVTEPARAQVWKKDASGKHVVGRSPTVVEHRYPVEVEQPSSWWWVLIGGAAVTSSVGVAFYSSNADSTAGKAVTYAGAGLLALSLAGYYVLSKWAVTELPPEPQSVILGASLDGYLDKEISLQVPGPDRTAMLVLPRDPGRPPPAAAAPRKEVAPAVAAVSPAGRTTVVAVFDVRDASRRFRPAMLDQLTEYLAARLTQVTRYRVVPRDQLRERLKQEKNGSFRKCYDQGCQIELGKAVAAQKSLATKILQVGKRCAVTSTLYDLKSETAERSALVRTDCDEDALMDTMDRIARQLSTGDFR